MDKGLQDEGTSNYTMLIQDSLPSHLQLSFYILRIGIALTGVLDGPVRGIGMAHATRDRLVASHCFT
jgi:hypothetical protein